MTETFIALTEDEFDAHYTPISNHLDANASWSYDEAPGCLFETYGAELEFVRQQAPGTIWTVVDGEDDDMYIVSGYHLVNRIGYLVTREAAPEGTCIEVRIPREHCEASLAKGTHAPSVSRVPFTTRLRTDYAEAIKRASLERQLSKTVPNTLQDILEEALEPWLQANGYLTSPRQ